MKSRKRWLSTLTLLAAFALIASACSDDGGDTTTAAPDTTAGATTAAPDTTAPAGGVPLEDFKLGILLVGPEFDQGYSQAHFEGAQYAIEQLGLPEDALISLDFINPADNPGLTPEGVAADMISQGADLVIFNSDDMRDGAFAAAEQNPDVPMIWVSGDSAWAAATISGVSP